MGDAEIRLTPRRLALLEAVAEGRVTEHYPLLPALPYSRLDRGEDASWPPSRYVRLTAEIAKLNRAGLVALDFDQPRSHYHEPRRWKITALGEQKLREARGG